MNKQQKLSKLKQEVIKLEAEIKEEENKDFRKIIYKNKEFRIYKWENKVLKDFPMPKGFDWCEFNDFIELYDKEKINMEVWKDYFVKHYSKLQQKEEYYLARVCLYRDLGLGSSSEYLGYSSADGRVVISRSLK